MFLRGRESAPSLMAAHLRGATRVAQNEAEKAEAGKRVGCGPSLSLGRIAETRTTQAPTAEAARGEPQSVRIGDVPTWRANAVLKVLAEP